MKDFFFALTHIPGFQLRTTFTVRAKDFSEAWKKLHENEEFQTALMQTTSRVEIEVIDHKV